MPFMGKHWPSGGSAEQQDFPEGCSGGPVDVLLGVGVLSMRVLFQHRGIVFLTHNLQSSCNIAYGGSLQVEDVGFTRRHTLLSVQVDEQSEGEDELESHEEDMGWVDIAAMELEWVDIVNQLGIGREEQVPATVPSDSEMIPVEGGGEKKKKTERKKGKDEWRELVEGVDFEVLWQELPPGDIMLEEEELDLNLFDKWEVDLVELHQDGGDVEDFVEDRDNEDCQTKPVTGFRGGMQKLYSGWESRKDSSAHLSQIIKC